MKNNTASRIHRVITAWKPIQPTEPALNGWMKVFSIPTKGPTRDYAQATQRLQLLLDELDLLRDKLSQKGTFEGVYQPTLSKLESAISPALLVHQGQHVKQHLTEDVYIGLGFCSELLPIEEEGIAAEEFQELVSIIHDLELLLQDSSFPDSLVALIRRHIRLAELAVSEYPIRGAAALKDAVKEAVGDLVFESAALAPVGEQNAKTIRRLWEKANKMADGAIKMDGLIQIGSKGIKLLTDLTS